MSVTGLRLVRAEAQQNTIVRAYMRELCHRPASTHRRSLQKSVWTESDVSPPFLLP